MDINFKLKVLINVVRTEEKYGSVQLSYRGEVSFNAPQIKVDSTLNT